MSDGRTRGSGDGRRQAIEGSPHRHCFSRLPKWAKRSTLALIGFHVLAHEVPVAAVFIYEFIYKPFN